VINDLKRFWQQLDLDYFQELSTDGAL
jgi:hypothetical protein